MRVAEFRARGGMGFRGEVCMGLREEIWSDTGWSGVAEPFCIQPF